MFKKYIFFSSFLMFSLIHAAETTTTTIIARKEGSGLSIQQGNLTFDLFFSQDRLTKEVVTISGVSTQVADVYLHTLPQECRENINSIKEQIDSIKGSLSSELQQITKIKDLPANQQLPEYKIKSAQNTVYDLSQQFFDKVKYVIFQHLTVENTKLGEKDVPSFKIAYVPNTTTTQDIKNYIYDELYRHGRCFFNVNINKNLITLEDDKIFPNESEIGIDSGYSIGLSEAYLSIDADNPNQIKYDSLRVPQFLINNKQHKTIDLIIDKQFDGGFKIIIDNEKVSLQQDDERLGDFNTQFHAIKNIRQLIDTLKIIQERSFTSNNPQGIENVERIYTFFKNSLYLWATLQSPPLRVLLEGAELKYKELHSLLLDINKLQQEAAAKSTTVNKKSSSSPKSSSWFSFNWRLPNLPKWDSVKNWFSTKAAYLFTAGVGIVTLGGFLSKYRSSWIPTSSLFKGSSDQSRSNIAPIVPTMSNINPN